MQANHSPGPQPGVNHPPRSSTIRLWRLVARRRRSLLLAVAALPLFQTTGCIPDVLGALSLQLQLLVNGVIIEAANTIIQNLLHL